MHTKTLKIYRYKFIVLFFSISACFASDSSFNFSDETIAVQSSSLLSSSLLDQFEEDTPPIPEEGIALHPQSFQYSLKPTEESEWPLNLTLPLDSLFTLIKKRGCIFKRNQKPTTWYQEKAQVLQQYFDAQCVLNPSDALNILNHLSILWVGTQENINFEEFLDTLNIQVHKKYGIFNVIEGNLILNCYPPPLSNEHIYFAQLDHPKYGSLHFGVKVKKVKSQFFWVDRNGKDLSNVLPF